MPSLDFADIGMDTLTQSAHITRSASPSGIPVPKASLLIIYLVSSKFNTNCHLLPSV